MKIYTLLTFFLLFLSSTCTLYAEAPRAAVAPISIFGDTSEAQKKIIFNRFESLLARFYRLYSQSQFKKAKEVVFESLAIDECTETYCIRKIQETLQVERLFFLEITHVEEVAQLKITLVHNEESLIEEGICSECTVEMLYEKIGMLVKRMVATDLGAAAVSDETFVPSQDTTAAEETGSLLGWHITATTLALLSSWYSVRIADEYNELADENSTIKAKTDTALSQSQYEALRQTYNDNLEKMKAQKEMIRRLDAAAVMCVAWEVYLLYRELQDGPETESAFKQGTYPLTVSAFNGKNQAEIRISLVWTW